MDAFLENLHDERFGAPGKYNILRCNVCGFGKTSPVLTKKQNIDLYTKYYPLKSLNAVKIKKSVNKHGKFVNWLLGLNNSAHLAIDLKNQKVLDIGSGSGVSLLEIKHRRGVPFGIDPDKNAKRLSKLLNLNFENKFITDNPFPKESFNFITASQVVEHVPDPVAFIKSSARRLAPEGRIVISTPNISSLFARILKYRWIHWHIPYHQNFFTNISAHKLATENGLKITHISTVTPNLWTILQFRALISRPVKEGMPADIWRVPNERNKPREVGDKYVKNLLAKCILLLLLLFIAPFNRLIDWFGFGESLFIVIEKKSRKRI